MRAGVMATVSVVALSWATWASANSDLQGDAAAVPSATEEAPASSSPSLPEAAGEVGVIVVTAQKREQRLQDVPVSVATYDTQTLDDAGVRDIKDLSQIAPGLVVTSTTDSFKTTARIRGIGTVGENSGLESSVGVVIDGVYRPRNGVGFGDLGELKRIEVLRGPQGTLFGKNTSAGVIQVITQDPYFFHETEVELTATEHEGYGVAYSATGPFPDSDDTAYRVYAVKRQQQGTMDVRTGGMTRPTDSSDEDFYSLRGTILSEPREDLTVRVRADFTQIEEDCCLGVTTRLGATAPFTDALAADSGVQMPANPEARIAYANRPNPQDIEDYGASVQVDWDNSWGTLTSVTALRFWDMVNGQDADLTSADILWRPADGTNGQDYRTLSQEFRLQGQRGPLDWLVGTYWAHEDHTRRDSYRFGSVYGEFLSLLATSGGSTTAFETALGGTNAALFPVTGGQTDVHEQDATTWALFTHNTYDFTDRLTGSLGLRFTRDEKEVQSVYRTTAPACAAFETAYGNDPASAAPTATLQALAGLACLPWARSVFDAASQSRTENEWSGTAKLQYDFTPTVMGYVSYARGYKAGGFNLDRDFTSLMSVDTSFEAETVDSYEIGSKSFWFDRQLMLNLTAYYQLYENYQLNTFTGTSFIVYAIPEVEGLGSELDFLYRTPIEGLKLQGGVAYTETEYGDQAFSIGTNARGPRALERNLPGSQVSLSPKWIVTLMGDYERAVPNSDLLSRFVLGTRYSSGYNTGSDLLPFKYQDEFMVWTARVAVTPSEEQWSFELWAENLFDETYKQVGYSTPLQGNDGVPLAPAANVYSAAGDTTTYGAFLGAPRTIGATFRLRLN